MDGASEGEEKPKRYSPSQGTAVQAAPTCDKTAVTLPPLSCLGKNNVDFSRSLTLLAVDD